MGLERDITEGRAAGQLLANEVFAHAIQMAREKVVQQWTAANSVEEREALWHDWHAVGRVVDQIDVIEGRGHIAQAALKQHAESVKRST